MILRKALLLCLLLLFICSLSQAQSLDNLNLESFVSTTLVDSKAPEIQEAKIILEDSINQILDSIVPLQIKDSIIFPPTQRDWIRLGFNTSLYAGFSVIGFGVLWTMPESTTNWNKVQMKEKGITWKWNENIKAGPKMDKDNWVLNWVSHPYFGGIYYITARSCGFSVLESFGYSAAMSTLFWEYGIEAFAEVPSSQDLIITPVVGSILGEGFFYAKKSILRHNKKVLKSRFLGITTLFLMDPFNTILDGFGYQKKVKTQMNVTPVGMNQFSKTPIWGLSFSASF